MCLARLEKFDVPEFGHKTGLIENDHFLTGDRGCILPLGEWAEDRNDKHLEADCAVEEYRTGFHIFPDYRDARGWAAAGEVASEIIVRVQIDPKSVTATGRDWRDAPIVVARRIKILGPVEAEGTASSEPDGRVA